MEEVQNLPTLPAVVRKINEVLSSPTANAADVGEIIAKDAALTAKTLKLVNSAFYGFPKKIQSVTRAIVILGFTKVKNVALSASIFDAFRGVTAKGFDASKFWEHSLGTAIATEVVTQELGLDAQEDAFVAGLLHDVGKIIIASSLKNEFIRIQSLIAEENLLMFEAEEKVLGASHAAIGKWLAEKWKFPESLVMSTARHHQPRSAREHRDLAYAVHLGDILARALGIGNGGDDGIPAIDETVWERFDMTEARLDKMCEATLIGATKAEAFFELIR